MEDSIKRFFWAVLYGISSIAFYTGLQSYVDYAKGIERRAMPLDINVREGFVKPSEIEVKLKDLDGSGKNETIISISGKDYLLKYDKNNEPIITPYEVKSAVIVELQK